MHDLYEGVRVRVTEGAHEGKTGSFICYYDTANLGVVLLDALGQGVQAVIPISRLDIIK